MSITGEFWIDGCRHCKIYLNKTGDERLSLSSHSGEGHPQRAEFDEEQSRRLVCAIAALYGWRLKFE